tara:strand:+ start:1466 stop:1780 length:315 start_codon:yes stop_codon:yes gene_type:complete
MEKYKNKDGIELSYTGNDIQTKLVKEVVGEAIKISKQYNMWDKVSCQVALSNVRKFLEVNFDIDDTKERNDQWKIEQFNRNRDPEEWVYTIEEFDKRIKEMFPR